MFESDKAKNMREMMDRLSEDPKDPFTKEVWPGSGGTYDIKSLQSMVARQLKELAESIATVDIDKPADPFYMRRVYKILYNKDNPVEVIMDENDDATSYPPETSKEDVKTEKPLEEPFSQDDLPF